MIALAKPDLWNKEIITVQRGDIWQLGQHRLMCGDSTNAEDITRLVQEKKAIAVITDPPYGMLETGWDNLALAFIECLLPTIEYIATVVAFCSLPFGFHLHTAMLHAGFQWRWDAVWTKANGGNGVSKKRPIPCHEHLFAYCRKGVAASELVFNGHDAGEQGEPWQRTNNSLKSRNQIQVRLNDRTHSIGRADGKRWIRSDLFGRSKNNLPEKERTSHPTQKPLEIVEKLALLLANENEVIYDPFLGSGTTLIASEQTGRTCYGMELSPEYCSVVIERWQDLTCQHAQRIEVQP